MCTSSSPSRPPALGLRALKLLLRQRELATDYRFFISAGLSYSFGSISDNVVNPRSAMAIRSSDALWNM
jgi:hypothetical protein